MSWRGPFAVGVAASIAVHLLLAFALLYLPELPLTDDPAAWEVALDVESARPDDLLASREAPHGSRPDRAEVPLLPGGARSRQNVDTFHRGGRGDTRGASDVILLLPRRDQITVQDSPMTALGVAQTQRIHTAATRATQEDRRATPNPDEDVYLASGAGVHRERRPVDAVDARTGARVAPDASEVGADVNRIPTPPRGGVAAGALAVSPGSGGRTAQAPVPPAPTTAGDQPRIAGGPTASPGRGIAAGTGERESEAARVATARPAVDQGRAATNSELRDARVRDDTDAELLAARMVQSMVESTTRRGTEVGAGRGGVGGGGDPGVGGNAGEGGNASPYGPGRGRFASLDTDDRRYVRWFLEQRRRIRRALVFPRERQLSMDQGTSVYRIVVRRDGTLANDPHLLRSSGFTDLDEAALAAIVRSTPFSPLPDELAPGDPQISVTMPIDFVNPMAGR